MKVNMSLKLTVYTIIITSTMMAISSTNMLMIWLSMEINLFSFILLLTNNSTTNEIEASINYFLPQALGSMMFLTSSSITLSLHWFYNEMSIIMALSMAMKLGMVPCHYWLPLTMEKISWMNCIILSTWQKIAPLFIMAYIIKPKINMMLLMASLNALTGGIMGLSQTSMKKIMAYSSITHMGWMLGGLTTKTPCLSIAYLILYSSISIPLFILLSKMNMNTLHQSWSKQNIPSNLKIPMIALLLSLSGLPPLTGFMPKLLMINILLKYSMMLTFILIFSSLLNLFFYLNISLNMFMSTKIMSHNNKSKTASNLINTILSTSSLGLMLTML